MRHGEQHRISSFCTDGGCVGVAPTADGVELIDISDQEAGRLKVSREAWAAFVAGVKAGEFDLPS